MPTPEREPFQFLGVNIIFDDALADNEMVMSATTVDCRAVQTYMTSNFDTDFFLRCRRAFHAAHRADPDDARVGTGPFDRASQIAALNATLASINDTPRRLTASEISARAASIASPRRAPTED